MNEDKKNAYFQIGVMKTKIGCSDQALMPRKRKILTHVWYQNKPHIKIFKDGFPNFSFYPPTAFWEGCRWIKIKKKDKIKKNINLGIIS